MTQTTVDRTAVLEIAALADKASAVQEITVEGRQFTDRPIHRVNTDAEGPQVVEFYTLDGFAGFLHEEQEAIGSIVHVVSPVRVEAFSELTGRDKHLRRRYAAAICKSATTLGFAFNQPTTLEALNIALQTCFDPTQGDIENLRKFCASVRSTQEIGVDDDSVSQTVAAKSGIAAIQTTPVRNPWALAPWRSFPEIAQPTSNYVLRFREADAPQAGLYETGDARWQVTAVQRVAEYLRGKLGTGWSVLG